MDWFKNDAQSVGVGGFTIENGIGNVVVHGSITLSADRDSLEQLRVFRERISELESALASAIEEGAFSGAVIVPVLETVDNPFS